MIYLLRSSAEKVLYVMDQFPDRDGFLINIDPTTGPIPTITLSVDLVHNNVLGKFVVEVQNPDSAP
jgi:hypothetical protein